MLSQNEGGHIMQQKRALLLSLIGGTVPFYVRGIAMEQSLVELEHYSLYTSPFFIDLFSISKSRVLAFFLLLAGLYLAYMVLKKRLHIPMNPMLLLPVVFMAIIGLTTLTSKYSEIVPIGFSERYEGAQVYVYYCMLIVLSGILLQNREDVYAVMRGIGIGSIPVTVIAFLQTMDIFPITSTRLEPFMFGLNNPVSQGAIAKYLETHRTFRQGFDFASTTLYNPNYYGVYSAVVLFVALGLFTMSKSRKGKLFSGVLVIVNFTGLLFSGSKAGFYMVLFFYILSCLLSLVEKSRKNLLHYGVLAGVMLIAFVGINTYSGGRVANRFFNVPTKSLTVNEEEGVDQSGFLLLQSIDIGEDSTILSNGQDNVVIKNTDQGLVLANEEELIGDWQYEYIDDVMKLSIQGHRAFLLALDDGRVSVIGPKGIVDVVPEPQPMLMNGYFLSSRGYIWSKVLPMIRERLWLGHGADTLAIYHPADDVINAFNYTSSTTSIAVNPHSLYLLLTFNFGLVGLFVFLIMVGVPLVRLLTQYIKNPKKRLYIRSIATPLVVFLALGLSNDTIIVTGVILYLLIGVVYTRTEDEKEVLMN